MGVGKRRAEGRGPASSHGPPRCFIYTVNTSRSGRRRCCRRRTASRRRRCDGGFRRTCCSSWRRRCWPGSCSTRCSPGSRCFHARCRGAAAPVHREGLHVQLVQFQAQLLHGRVFPGDVCRVGVRRDISVGVDRPDAIWRNEMCRPRRWDGASNRPGPAGCSAPHRVKDRPTGTRRDSTSSAASPSARDGGPRTQDADHDGGPHFCLEV